MNEEEDDDPEFPIFTYNITREGKLISVDERFYWMPKVELIDGVLFWNSFRRRHVLSMLLENFGIDEAVAIGDPQLWKEAIEARLQREKTP